MFDKTLSHLPLSNHKTLFQLMNHNGTLPIDKILTLSPSNLHKSHISQIFKVTKYLYGNMGQLPSGLGLWRGYLSFNAINEISSYLKLFIDIVDCITECRNQVLFSLKYPLI